MVLLIKTFLVFGFNFEVCRTERAFAMEGRPTTRHNVAGRVSRSGFHSAVKASVCCERNAIYRHVARELMKADIQEYTFEVTKCEFNGLKLWDCQIRIPCKLQYQIYIS